MRTLRLSTLILLLGTLILMGCQDSEKQVRQAMAALTTAPQGDEQALDAAFLEAKTQALLVQDKDLRASLAAELGQIYQQRKAPFEQARRQAAEEQRRRQEMEHARQRAAASANRLIDGIKGLRWSTRWSLMDDGTKVLILRNVKGYSVDFSLKCYTRNGASRTLFVSVPAYKSKEIGFLEGWPGNFVSGEKCEAYHEGTRLWTINIT